MNLFQACENEVFYGRLVIGITDDPFPVEMISEASIRVFKLEAHPKNAEEDTEMILLSEDTVKYNLLDLRNGVVETLVDVDIQSGEYDYFRMYVDKASLSIIDGETFDVKVPSGSTSGIKVKVDPSVVVEEGLTTELILDIDLSQSFVINGNYSTPAGIKGFNFKPVIRVINVTETGRIEGHVKDSEGKSIESVFVWLDIDNTKVSTFSDEAGYYNLIGIPTGIHSINAEKEGYVTQFVDNIVVVSGNMTTRDLTLTK